jgi:hypothetical protein
MVSILGDPSAKLKSIDYYPVINTHITDNKAAHECPRYSENGAKDVGQIHGRLNNILTFRTILRPVKNGVNVLVQQ